MFESLGFENLTAPQAAVWFGVLLGLAFGGLAERTRFCFRRAVVGSDRRQAAGVWMMALAVAVLGTQAAVAADWIAFDDHRFFASDLPIGAIVIGGLLFGAGMVLTRGCVSRLTVLAGTGNLRAATCLVLFAVVAHATLKGVLAPVRTAVATVTLPLGDSVSLAALPGGAWVWSAIVALAALFIALRWRNGVLPLIGGALIGLLVPLGWVGTGFVLYDDFDPIALSSLSFTAPHADTLFWTVAATALPANFGVGLIGGTLVGALLASLAFGTAKWQSFSAPGETGRYLIGAAMMGVGGVLAGGCTIGAGLAGIPTLGVAAILTLAFIALGGFLTDAALNRRGLTAAAVPAE